MEDVDSISASSGRAPTKAHDYEGSANMSEKELNERNSKDIETEEPVQDSASDDVEAHRHFDSRQLARLTTPNDERHRHSP